MGGSVSELTHEGTSGRKRFPDPDYDHHSAYGKLFGKPKLATRLRELMKWGRGCVPLLRNMSRTSFKRTRRLLTGWGMRSAAAAPSSEHSRLLADIRRDGAVAIRLSPDETARVSRSIDRFVEDLEARRARIPDGRRKHRDNVLAIPRRDAAELYSELDGIFESHGTLWAASRYLGFPVRYNCNLQINEPSDTSFWKGKFTDIELPFPQTTYMHIDSTMGNLKCILYLDRVTEQNGPFSYVLGSNRKKGASVLRPVPDQGRHPGKRAQGPPRSAPGAGGDRAGGPRDLAVPLPGSAAVP